MRDARREVEPPSGGPPLTPERFRSLFPAASTVAWLDTPASPPAASPVSAALTAAIGLVTSGERSWVDWSDQHDVARGAFADWLGVSRDDVATMTSVAEASATVAGSVPPGPVVVGANEFRSNLFAWQQLDPDRNPLHLVGETGRGMDEGELLDAITPGTSLVAVSTVLTSDGCRVDLRAVRDAAGRAGARLFVDATQSLGAIHLDHDGLRPDYLAVHGYKWMLAPRGAAWLVVAPAFHEELPPLAPGWVSHPDHAFFGGRLERGAGVRHLDSSPAWLSWIGAVAALDILAATEPTSVERHCTGLARSFREQAVERGVTVIGPDSDSHIVLARPRSPAAVAEALASGRLRATMLGPHLRLGFHYFNDSSDVDEALRVATARRPRACAEL